MAHATTNIHDLSAADDFPKAADPLVMQIASSDSSWTAERVTHTAERTGLRATSQQTH